MDERLLRASEIVLDVGNVLLTFEPEKVASLLPEGLRSAFYPALFEGDKLWSKFDLGRESNEEIARQIAQKAGMPEEWPQALGLLTAFPSIMRPLPLYHLIPELKDMGKRLFALTNYGEPSFTITCRLFPHLTELDGVVVSSREKLAKPDPAIYRLLLSRFGITPGRALFIDDTLVNVQAAEKEGIMGWHYAGPDRL